MRGVNVEQCLREFITKFQASLDPRLWLKLVDEETTELLDADRNDEGREAVLKEAVDVAYVMTGFALVADGSETVELVDELTRQEWTTAIDQAGEVTLHMIKKYGFSDDVLQEGFRRVHASNMSKLDEKGRPIRREDGKIMKGPNYRAPDLADLV